MLTLLLQPYVGAVRCRGTTTVVVTWSPAACATIHGGSIVASHYVNTLACVPDATRTRASGAFPVRQFSCARRWVSDPVLQYASICFHVRRHSPRSTLGAPASHTPRHPPLSRDPSSPPSSRPHAPPPHLPPLRSLHLYIVKKKFIF